MSLVSAQTRVIVQGLTGRRATQFAHTAMQSGTRIVAGVTPGKGGHDHLGIPVFNTVRSAREQTDANATIIFVPTPGTSDALNEAVDEGLELVVCPAEGVPVHDMITLREKLRALSSAPVVVGPNCPGIIVPGQCLLGIMPEEVFLPGRTGVVTRSGTLTYELVQQMSEHGVGQSACIGVGADAVVGLSLADAAERLLDDASTDSLVVIGEIGGSAEEQLAARLLERRRSGAPDKPVIACIAGRTAPAERRMGHAGAIITGGIGTARAKIDALTEAGVTCATSPAGFGELVAGIVSP